MEPAADIIGHYVLAVTGATRTGTGSLAGRCLTMLDGLNGKRLVRGVSHQESDRV